MYYTPAAVLQGEILFNSSECSRKVSPLLIQPGVHLWLSSDTLLVAGPQVAETMIVENPKWHQSPRAWFL